MDKKLKLKLSNYKDFQIENMIDIYDIVLDAFTTGKRFPYAVMLKGVYDYIKLKSPKEQKDE